MISLAEQRLLFIANHILMGETVTRYSVALNNDRIMRRDMIMARIMYKYYV